MSVLIVDDDPVFRRAMQRALRVETRTSSSVIAGIHDAQSWQPAVILLDVQFADSQTSGIDAINEFLAASPRSKVVVVTSLFREEDSERARLLGAFIYLEKGDSVLIRCAVEEARRRVPSVFSGSSYLIQ